MTPDSVVYQACRARKVIEASLGPPGRLGCQVTTACQVNQGLQVWLVSRERWVLEDSLGPEGFLACQGPLASPAARVSLGPRETLVRLANLGPLVNLVPTDLLVHQDPKASLVLQVLLVPGVSLAYLA